MLNNSNISKFWELNKNSKLQKSFNQVRTHEEMRELAIKAIEAKEITEDNKYYDYVRSFAVGGTVCNEFGKKLYFRRFKQGAN